MATRILIQDSITAPSRRNFLIGSCALYGGFLVGFGEDKVFAQTVSKANTASSFKYYVKITPDNIVTIYSAHMDMGQGSYNGVATLLAEELGCDWSQIRVEGASSYVPAYGNLAWGGALQGTGGSSAMVSSFDRYRIAGASAREMLKAAAAQEWAVPVTEIKVSKGVLSHSSGKSALFGAYAAKAAQLNPPAYVQLKQPEDWILIGNETLKRFDSVEKNNGTLEYIIDLKLPGMLTAIPIHPPLFGATIRSFDASKAKFIKGMVDVVLMARGISVVAENMWAAIQGRELVSVVWDETLAEKRSSVDISAEYKALSKKPGVAVAKDYGNVDAGFKTAVKVIEADYEFPYLAHAALEPLNAAVRMNADGTLEIWGGHQMPDIYQAVAAQIAGITPDKVKLHIMKTGGSFGRRAVVDADVIAEAVSTAKALGFKNPVKMQWTREDDMRGGRYRPAYVHALKAGLDKEGRIIAWQNHIVGQSINQGTILAQQLVKNGVDSTSVEGASDIPYAIPNLKIELTTTNIGIPVLWWRAVGSTHTTYCVETFMDELAFTAGKDPIEYRLSMLQNHPRLMSVLKLAAEKAGWGNSLPEGHFQGVAIAEAFKSYVAQIVEVALIGSKISVKRVICAIDCGIAINPDIIRQQMEGSIAFGLGAIIKSQLSLDKGMVVESNFDDYEVMRMVDMPPVDVYIVPSSAPPTGVGEPGVAPIGPAFANAVFAATKRRVRILPFTRSENS